MRWDEIVVCEGGVFYKGDAISLKSLQAKVNDLVKFANRTEEEKEVITKILYKDDDETALKKLREMFPPF